MCALAKEPFPNPLNPKFMIRHKFTSPGSTQAAHKKLIALDLIERRDYDGRYRVIDPLFDSYLKKGVEAVMKNALLVQPNQPMPNKMRRY